MIESNVIGATDCPSDNADCPLCPSESCYTSKSNPYGTSGVGNWGSTGSDEVKVTVPQTGNYRFVFISGTFEHPTD